MGDELSHAMYTMSQCLLRFYAAKDEEVDSDSDEEEDEVLDFHKQKSEVIFWNDPRIR